MNVAGDVSIRGVLLQGLRRGCTTSASPRAGGALPPGSAPGLGRRLWWGRFLGKKNNTWFPPSDLIYSVFSACFSAREGELALSRLRATLPLGNCHPCGAFPHGILPVEVPNPTAFIRQQQPAHPWLLLMSLFLCRAS